MTRTRSPLVVLAVSTGVLTIVTSDLFARMPDRFVDQFGWFIAVLGPAGGLALIAAAFWYRSGREPRAAAAVMATLAFGDFLFNAAALRAASLGVIPSPNFLLGLTAAASMLLSAGALWAAFRSPPAERRHVPWAAALMLAGAAIGAAIAFEGMFLRALEPHRAAVEECRGRPSPPSDAPLHPLCVEIEQAKPLSNDGFLAGLAGFGAMSFGLGALTGPLLIRETLPRTMSRVPATAVASVLGIGLFVLAGYVGVADLNRLHSDCRISGPPIRPTQARVITDEEQAFRDCVVARAGGNPWGLRFWLVFGAGSSALLGAGLLVTSNAREGTHADIA